MDPLLRELLSAQSVAFAYSLYAKTAVPKDASPVQAFITEVSYYAGVDWVLRRILETAKEDGEDKGADLIDAFLEETTNFVRDYEERRLALEAKAN